MPLSHFLAKTNPLLHFFFSSDLKRLYGSTTNNVIFLLSLCYKELINITCQKHPAQKTLKTVEVLHICLTLSDLICLWQSGRRARSAITTLAA